MSCFKICKVRGCNEENQNFILHRAIPVTSVVGYARKKGNSLHRGYNPAMKGVPGSIQLITKDMASQAECDPDEFRFFQLPADSSRRQTVPELSGSPCLICYDRDSGAVDWPAEI